MPDDKVSIKQTATRLRKARKAAGLTQVQVAEKAGISQTYYAQIERAEKNPTTSIFVKIVKSIGVSADDILEK